jgi:predicted dithiol-disulfide oxidoreductase (DUF899 family)
MKTHRTGTRSDWLSARLELLKAEKELTRSSDELARRRRQLPWVPVEKEYVFDAVEGEKSLRELFSGRSQLLVYHFMFGPTWIEGCPGCSLHADAFDRTIVHLQQRDVTMLCVSRAPLDQLEAYKRRMGWGFTWVSSQQNDFNFDFGVSFPPEGNADLLTYNFTTPWRLANHGRSGIAEEHAGLSAFALEDGIVYHTYSCYTRGLEAFNATYQLLDRAPRGRDEDHLEMPFSWLRRRDQYDTPIPITITSVGPSSDKPKSGGGQTPVAP